MRKISKDFISKLWNSATLLTWGSLAAKLANLTILLPWVLRKFTVEETSLWLLLSIFIGIQIIIDLGFSQTFSRIIAYAKNESAPRARDFDAPSLLPKNSLNNVVSAMRLIYRRLAIWGFVLIATIGTMAVSKSVNAVPNSIDGWIAWLIVIASSTYSLYGNQYTAYLIGVERIAVLRRWEIVTTLAAIASSVLVLLFDGGLLALVAVTQAWQCVSVIRNKFLVASVDSGQDSWEKLDRNSKVSENVWGVVWPSAWRSGVGVLFSYGIVQASGILYAQFLPVKETAQYLLALKIIQTISQFSQAPFYSKLPTMARLYAGHNFDDILHIARRGARISFWTFCAGVVSASVFVPILLKIIGSQTNFVPLEIWFLISIAFFFERVGAMHIQLYSLTNKIVWHIANGVTGALMIAGFFFLFERFGSLTFPLVMLISYLCFYCPYSMYHSYREYPISFPVFEFETSVLPFLVILVVAGLMIFWGSWLSK